MQEAEGQDVPGVESRADTGEERTPSQPRSRKIMRTKSSSVAGDEWKLWLHPLHLGFSGSTPACPSASSAASTSSTAASTAAANELAIQGQHRDSGSAGHDDSNTDGAHDHNAATAATAAAEPDGGKVAGAGSSGGGSSSLEKPEGLLLHEEHYAELEETLVASLDSLPVSARLAAASSAFAVGRLAKLQANPNLFDAVASMRQVQVSLCPADACIRMVWMGPAEDEERAKSMAWELELPLLGAEVWHHPLGAQVGGFAVSLVPCPVRAPGTEGKGLYASNADGDLTGGTFPGDALRAWVFVFDGSDLALLNVLNSLSSCGAIRTGLAQAFRMTERSLGSGGCATVYVAQGIASGAYLALKLSREAGSKADRSLTHEIALAVAARGHPNVVTLLGIFRTESPFQKSALQWAVALELCVGGDLQQRVARLGPHSEGDIGPILKGALAGLCHIHERGIVHRDIKSENILLKENLLPVVTDFGVAAFTSDEEAMSCRCGSAGYVAPEVLRAEKPYDTKVDVFGIGVTLYFMLSARLPFSGRDVAQVLRRNMRCIVDWDRDYHLQRTSPMGKAFLRRLMEADADTRPSALESLQDIWWEDYGQAQLIQMQIELRQRQEQQMLLQQQQLQQQQQQQQQHQMQQNQSDSPSHGEPGERRLQPMPPSQKPDPSRAPPRRGFSAKTVPAALSHPPEISRPEDSSLGEGPPAGISKSEAPDSTTLRTEELAEREHRTPSKNSQSRLSPHTSMLGSAARSLLLGHGRSSSNVNEDADDEDSPNGDRRGLRKTLGQRLHTAIAAGIGLTRVPNFEMQMERRPPAEGVKTMRRFKLMTDVSRVMSGVRGGSKDKPEEAQPREGSRHHSRDFSLRMPMIGRGQSFRSLLSDHTDDEDGHHSDRTWHSFGRGSEGCSAAPTQTTLGPSSHRFAALDQAGSPSPRRGPLKRGATGGFFDERQPTNRSLVDRFTWGRSRSRNQIDRVDSHKAKELQDCSPDQNKGSPSGEPSPAASSSERPGHWQQNNSNVGGSADVTGIPSSPGPPSNSNSLALPSGHSSGLPSDASSGESPASSWNEAESSRRSQLRKLNTFSQGDRGRSTSKTDSNGNPVNGALAGPVSSLSSSPRKLRRNRTRFDEDVDNRLSPLTLPTKEGESRQPSASRSERPSDSKDPSSSSQARTPRGTSTTSMLLDRFRTKAKTVDFEASGKEELLPSTQAASKNHTEVVSAAAACSEACNRDQDEMDLGMSASRTCPSESASGGLSLGRSLRGRLGSFVTKKWMVGD